MIMRRYLIRLFQWNEVIQNRFEDLMLLFQSLKVENLLPAIINSPFCQTQNAGHAFYLTISRIITKHPGSNPTDQTGDPHSNQNPKYPCFRRQSEN